MELHERIAFVRKAAGLSQEQLGELLGVTRQAVSKWESGQTTPDAVTVARLCEALHVSADFVLLGKEPEERAAPPLYAPDACPCCGRPVSGTICPVCGYHLPDHPPRGRQYALVALIQFSGGRRENAANLTQFCGYTQEQADALLEQLQQYGTRVLLRRGLSDNAVQYLAAQLGKRFSLRIAEDCGEEEDALLQKPAAMKLPEAAGSGGLGFWGTVGAVVVGIVLALLVLSVF